MDLPNIPWWQRIIQRLASIEFISSGFLSKYLHRMDTAVLNWTHGKKNLTQMLTGLPVVVITTTGAKSGKPRTIPLAGIPDGEKIILRAQLGQNGDSREYTARIANQDEWGDYWSLAVHYYSGYQSYLERSGDREIPLFVLEPVR